MDRRAVFKGRIANARQPRVVQKGVVRSQGGEPSGQLDAHLANICPIIPLYSDGRTRAT